MTTLWQHLLDPGWLSLRDVARLLLLSLLFTVAASMAFPRNAVSRRALLLSAVVALTILPWLLAQLLGVWTIALPQKPSFTLATPLPNILVWVWLGGAALGLLGYGARIGLELLQLRRLPVIDDPALAAQVGELAARLEIDHPRIMQGEAACSITIDGAKLILPANWECWSQSTLQAVLAHELIHIQRRDDRWLLATRVLILIYWWMPWLRMLARHHERVMEESCDDAASDLIGTPTAYAHALGAAAGVPRLRSATGMHRYHVAARIGRFSSLRGIELDAGAVYWCVVAITGFVIALTSLEPVQRQLPSRPMISVLPAPQTDPADPATSVFPRVSDRIETSSLPSRFDEGRYTNPEHEAPAIYPGYAIRHGIEGSVTVRFNIAADGSVSQLRIVSATPPGVFDDAALRAVSNTRYAPAYKTDSAFIAKRAASRPPTQVTRQFQFTLSRE